MERRKQRQLAEIGFERKRLAEEEAKRKAEKHQAAQQVVNLKKQLLEIRVAKAFIGSLNQNVPKPATQEREFAVGGAQKAA
jgi:F0F1-type ATP synthase assembly protein I